MTVEHTPMVSADAYNEAVRQRDEVIKERDVLVVKLGQLEEELSETYDAVRPDSVKDGDMVLAAGKHIVLWDNSMFGIPDYYFVPHIRK